MKKFFTMVLVLALTLTMGFAVLACSDSDDNTPADTSITVTDQAGRSVTIDAPATRIVSGYYISSSACIALGLEDKLVGIETGMNQRPIYDLATELSYEKVANVGSANNFELEAAIAANPDLVILPTKAANANVEPLEALDIPVVVVSPESHEELVEMIQLIAKLTDTETKANALVNYYNTKIEMIEELTKDIAEGDKKTVYMAGTSSYLSTVPKDMYQASIITSAGGINAGKDLPGNSWKTVTLEDIVTMNPDIIVIPTNSNANNEPDYDGDGSLSSKEVILAEEGLSMVKAVTDGEIYNMPYGLESWDSPVPSGVLGMLWMLNLLHPDLYTTEEFLADATDFYKTFYGFDLDTTIITGAIAD